MSRPAVHDPTTYDDSGASSVLRRDVAVLLLYTAFTVWWSWPLPRLWHDHLLYRAEDAFGALGAADAYLITWILSWVAHAIGSPLHLFDGNILFPAPLSLAFSEHLIGYLPLFGPTYWLTGNPILALGVASFLTHPLCAFCTYLLVRRWCGSGPALVSGLVFAFTPARYLTPPHWHMLGVQYLPLVLLLLERWLETGRTRFALLLGAAVALQALCSVYLMYAVFLLLVPALPLFCWHYRRSLPRLRARDAALAVCIAALPLAAVMWPYLRLRAWGLVPSYDGVRTSLGLIPWVAWVLTYETEVEHGLGWWPSLLALFGVLAGGRIAGAWPRRVGVVLALFGVLVSLGPSIWTPLGEVWSPYRLLQLVPGFDAIRMPARFLVLAQLGTAILVGVGVAVVVRGRSLQVEQVVVLVSVAAIAWRAHLTPPLAAHREAIRETLPPEVGWLAAHGAGRAVLELPAAADVTENARRAYLSTFHWLPIVDGYTAYAPLHRREIHWIARQLPAERALHELLDLVDVGWIVVHRDRLPGLARSLWNGPLPEGLVLRAEWGDVALYEVTFLPASTRRDRLLSLTETLDGAPIAPLTGPCPGSLEVREWPVEPIVSSTEVRATVIVENRSDLVWPAHGFLPHGLVHLEGLIRTHDGRVFGEPLIVPLREDVHPGRPVAVTLRVPAPPAGTYRLELGLVQDGVLPLARCGVASRELSLTTRGDASAG